MSRAWVGDPALERLIRDLAEYELTSEEGVQYAPKILIERDAQGTVCRLEVGLSVTLPETDADGNHLVTHTTTLVPSTATGEGDGNGNVFWYEDDDALSHIAWHPDQESGTVTDEPHPAEESADEPLSSVYLAAREAYWDEQKRFRAATVTELRRLMPAYVYALTFDMSDDPCAPRLRLDGWLDEDGAEHDTAELEDVDAYDVLDQLAADVEAFSWEEADSFLRRTDDGRRFIVLSTD